MPVTPRTLPPTKPAPGKRQAKTRATPPKATPPKDATVKPVAPVAAATALAAAQPDIPDRPPAGNPGADVKTDGTKARADYSEVGSTGLQQWGGNIHEEFLRALQGDRGRKTYREMADNDPVIGGMLFAIDMLTRQVDWHLEPAYVAPPTPPPPGPPPMPVVGPGAQLPVDEANRAHQTAQSDAQRQHEAAQATQSQVAQIGQASIQAGGPGKRDQKSPLRKSAFNWETPSTADERSEHLAEVRQLIRKSLGEPVIGSDEQVHQAEEAAAFVESCFTDMSVGWDDTLSAILSFIPYGWSYHEIVYKRRLGPDQKTGNKRSKYDDGKVGWRKIVLRSQDSLLRWEFDEDSESVLGMHQLAPGHPMVYLPLTKSLLFRTTSAKGNPEGRSALRNAFRPWWFKKRIEESEAVGIERDLAGLPVAGVPVEYLTDLASPSQIATVDTIKNIVRNIKRDDQEGVVWPVAYDEGGNKLFTLELLSTGGQRQVDTDKVIGRYDQRIAMTLLADFILLGHENVGSKSLGASKIDLFMAAIEAWLYHIADVFNTHAIPRLLRLNGIDVRMAPRLTFGAIQPVDLQALGEFLGKMAGTGMPLFPDEELDGYLRTAAGLPAKTAPDPLEVLDEEV